MVECVVQVPESTPAGHPVFLAGDGAILGDWAATGVRLDQSHDGTYYARLNLGHGFSGRFLVTLGRWRSVEGDGQGREVAPRSIAYDQNILEVRVRGWGRDSIHYHHHFTSRYLPHSRTISVWLPPGYNLEQERRFPVFYMHDGQNLFDPHTAFAGNPWYADEVAEREIHAGTVEPFILVGVANTVDRLREYGTRRPGPDSGPDLSREYGRMLVEEVKPFIDATYRTRPEADATGVGGSSMGGLISLQLCQWYPDVFRRCAAISPSLWWDREYFLQNLSSDTQWLERCRLWVDMGNREGGSEAGMRAMVGRAARLARQFARHSNQFVFLEAEDGYHNEASWGGRFDQVLRFLYPRS